MKKKIWYNVWREGEKDNPPKTRTNKERTKDYGKQEDIGHGISYLRA